MSSSEKTKKKRLGRYEVESQIGKGSAANIYLAKQDYLGRKLVIKELLPLHAANDKIVARFKREAQIVSQLTHETIVHVYDYWVKSNTYYIAMEYVPGKNLKEILDLVHHVPVHIAAAILYQICRGLRCAHTNGVVHRDLKPANIMVSHAGQVKILDFGIAHFQQGEHLTSLGAVIGTFHYMSPEQALGKHVTPASDIFSLGILFYELVTGTKPFMKDDRGDILEKIVRCRYHSPSKINPAVTRHVRRIIRKCMRKRVKRRYKDVGQIQKKLERLLRRHPLDHQVLLTSYMDHMEKWEPDENWPPGFWRRLGYRITHMRPRTYFLILLVLGAAAYGEYRLLSRGIGVAEQWKSAQETIQVVSSWFKKIPQPEIESVPAVLPDTTSVPRSP